VTGPAPSEQFMAAAHPRQPELDQLVRELRQHVRTLKVHTLHADIVWRLRRGETVTLPSLLALWPLGEERISRYVRDLQLWGLVSIEGTTITLARDA
jgi:hypothetical protein